MGRLSRSPMLQVPPVLPLLPCNFRNSQIRVQLNPFVGHLQITLIGEAHWKTYPTWRKKNGRGRSGGMVSDGAIRQEMTTFRSVLRFAATKNYIRENQLPRGAIQSDNNRREEFTTQEYRKLHTFGRHWIKEARWDMHTWYRTMAYNFMLVMTNTGMRPPEARNLRWRDVDTRPTSTAASSSPWTSAAKASTASLSRRIASRPTLSAYAPSAKRRSPMIMSLRPTRASPRRHFPAR